MTETLFALNTNIREEKLGNSSRRSTNAEDRNRSKSNEYKGNSNSKEKLNPKKRRGKEININKVDLLEVNEQNQKEMKEELNKLLDLSNDYYEQRFSLNDPLIEKSTPEFKQIRLKFMQKVLSKMRNEMRQYGDRFEKYDKDRSSSPGKKTTQLDLIRQQKFRKNQKLKEEMMKMKDKTIHKIKLLDLKVPGSWRCRGQIEKKLNLLKYSPEQIIGRRIIAHDYDSKDKQPPRTHPDAHPHPHPHPTQGESSTPNLGPSSHNPREQIIKVNTFVPIKNMDKVVRESEIPPPSSAQKYRRATWKRPASEFRQGRRAQKDYVWEEREGDVIDLRLSKSSAGQHHHYRLDEDSTLPRSIMKKDTAYVYQGGDTGNIYPGGPMAYTSQNFHSSRSAYGARGKISTPVRKNRHKILNFAIDGKTPIVNYSNLKHESPKSALGIREIENELQRGNNNNNNNKHKYKYNNNNYTNTPMGELSKPQNPRCPPTGPNPGSFITDPPKPRMTTAKSTDGTIMNLSFLTSADSTMLNTQNNYPFVLGDNSFSKRGEFKLSRVMTAARQRMNKSKKGFAVSDQITRVVTPTNINKKISFHKNSNTSNTNISGSVSGYGYGDLERDKSPIIKPYFTYCRHCNQKNEQFEKINSSFLSTFYENMEKFQIMRETKRIEDTDRGIDHEEGDDWDLQLLRSNI